MNIATISSKGQITLPKAIMNLLQVQYGEKVVLYPDNDFLLIKPLAASIVDQTAGSLKQYVPKAKLGIPFAEIQKQMQKTIVQKLVQTI